MTEKNASSDAATSAASSSHPPAGNLQRRTGHSDANDAATQNESENSLCDEQKQEEIIAALATEHQSRKNQFKYVLLFLGTCFVALNCWNLWMVVSTPKILTLVSLVVSLGVLAKELKVLRIPSFILSFCALAYALYHFRSIPYFLDEDFVYTPVILNVIVQMFLSDMTHEETNIAKLRAMRFPHKTA